MNYNRDGNRTPSSVDSFRSFSPDLESPGSASSQNRRRRRRGRSSFDSSPNNRTNTSRRVFRGFDNINRSSDSENEVQAEQNTQSEVIEIAETQAMPPDPEPEEQNDSDDDVQIIPENIPFIDLCDSPATQLVATQSERARLRRDDSAGDIIEIIGNISQVQPMQLQDSVVDLSQVVFTGEFQRPDDVRITLSTSHNRRSGQARRRRNRDVPYHRSPEQAARPQQFTSPPSRPTIPVPPIINAAPVFASNNGLNDIMPAPPVMPPIMPAHSTPTRRNGRSNVAQQSILLNGRNNVAQPSSLIDANNGNQSIAPLDLSQCTQEEKFALRCPICMESALRRSPYSTKCGHIFCENCIKTALRNKKSCPMCNTGLTVKFIHPIFIP